MSEKLNNKTLIHPRSFIPERQCSSPGLKVDFTSHQRVAQTSVFFFLRTSISHPTHKQKFPLQLVYLTGTDQRAGMINLTLNFKLNRGYI